MKFEWDERKRLTNLRKHEVRFEDATTAFDDPFALVESDDDHSEQERFRMIGEADLGVLVVIFTERADAESTRIISARKPTREEKQLYENLRTFPL